MTNADRVAAVRRELDKHPSRRRVPETINEAQTAWIASLSAAQPGTEPPAVGPLLGSREARCLATASRSRGPRPF